MSTPIATPAQWVVRAPLEEGFAVRGAVRSAEKCAHLREVFASHGDKFELVVVPDITQVCVIKVLLLFLIIQHYSRKAHSTRQSKEWMRSNTPRLHSIYRRTSRKVRSGGLHCALDNSPVGTELIRPAIHGTVGILQSALKHG